MDGPFEVSMRAAEFAMLRAALIAVFLRDTVDEPEIVSMSAEVRCDAQGQFEVDIEFRDQAGFAVGGLSV